MASIPSLLQDYIIDNIQLGKQIGGGAHGRILEAKWGGAVVAVKEIHSIFINEVSEPEFQSYKRNFLRECEQSSRLCHPNIVRFLGIYHPPGARVPSLVMERLHCSLTNLLEHNVDIPIGIKLSIVYDVALGLRYLHSCTPPIIHRDLSSNNVLISKGMEGKIGDLGTVRLVDPTRQSRMTKAPGTVDFMPPEALAATEDVKYERELDVFSFGCVMLHTLSHQWPTPSEPVVTDPVTLEVKGCTEVQRRSSFFSRVDKNKSGMLVPLIESCLSNLPKNRTSILRVCEQLEGTVDRENVPVNCLTASLLQQEVKRKDDEIQNKNFDIKTKEDKIYCQATELINKDKELQARITEIQRKEEEIKKNNEEIKCKNEEIERKNDDIKRKEEEIHHQAIQLKIKESEIQTVRSTLSKLQVTNSPQMLKQVSKSSDDFWKSLELTWQNCADFPEKCWIISVAELDGKVFVSVRQKRTPYMFDFSENQWSVLPELPYIHFSLVAVSEMKQLLAIGGTLTGKISNEVFLLDDDKWIKPYPNMPTARYDASCISSGSSVIVTGGTICYKPNIVTRAVEVLHIKQNSWFFKSYWTVVEQLPHVVYAAVPLVVGDSVYIAVGADNNSGYARCAVVTAPLTELLNGKSTSSSGQVWSKLPDMPYPSYSISYYQDRLVTFTALNLVEQPDGANSVYELLPLIHLYNSNTLSWDCVGYAPFEYYLGRSVHIENKIMFIGGLTGTYDTGHRANLVKTCAVLTLKQL